VLVRTQDAHNQDGTSSDLIPNPDLGIWMWQIAPGDRLASFSEEGGTDSPRLTQASFAPGPSVNRDEYRKRNKVRGAAPPELLLRAVDFVSTGIRHIPFSAGDTPSIRDVSLRSRRSASESVFLRSELEGTQEPYEQNAEPSDLCHDQLPLSATLRVMENLFW
jgi:hypothetical protein